MTTEKATELEAADKLKGRMAAAKIKVPKPYISVYEYKYGPQSEDQRSRIRQAYNLRLADEEITKNFETLAKQTK